MTSKESDSFIGDIVSTEEVTGQLRIVKELHASKNGISRVLLGERMGKRVIIKTLKPKHSDNPQFLLMLRKEFEIGVSLSHPGIVSTIDYCTLEGLGECIIEEFIDGESLEELIQKNEINLEKALSILITLAETLVYIHQKGIIHADLKPSNIMISHFYGMPKIIDFGFSDGLDYVSVKANGGTSGYIAPERREENYVPSPQTDIWSMGQIIANLADKLKGPEKHGLKKIASECQKPVRERIPSAENLLSLLKATKKRPGNKQKVFKGIFVYTLVLFSIGAFFMWQLNTGEKEDQLDRMELIPPEAKEIKDSYTPEITPAIQEKETESNDDMLGADRVIVEKNTVTTKIPEVIEVTEYNPRVADENISIFTKRGREFTDQHIEETITALKEKGLYRKAKTIGEQWNSRYIYDKIIKEISEYVDQMPIPSEKIRNEVKTEVVDYARHRLEREEEKLESVESHNQ